MAKIVFSDNGPQFTSFSQFVKTYDFQHVTSSPFYPQSNGLAERTVQTVKALLRDAEDEVSLNPIPMVYPLACWTVDGETTTYKRSSPSYPVGPRVELCGGISTTRPCLQKENYDQRYRVRSQPQLSTDSDVWITSEREPIKGSIVQPAAAPLSHLVETPSGRIRHNRRHLNIDPKKRRLTSRQMEQVYTKRWV